MVTFGRKNIRSLQTGNNQGMARRADKRLDATVDAYAAKFKTALAVDGNPAFIFNKMKGITPCTCRGMQNLAGYGRHESGSTGHETKTGAISVHSPNHRSAPMIDTSAGKVMLIDDLLETNQLDSFFTQKNNYPVVSKISGKDDEGYTDDPAYDILDALSASSGMESVTYSGNGDPMQDILNATNLGNSTNFPYTANMVSCPICFGAGYVDTWQLYNGQRLCLDASNRFNFDIYNDVEIDEQQPALFSVRERSFIVWRNVGLPLSWRLVLRLALFKGTDQLPQDSYQLYFTTPFSSVKQPLDYNVLKQLNNGNILRQSNKLDIYLESRSEEPLTFTHLEFLFSLGEPTRMQIPEMNVPYEGEYVDYNLNATFETSSDIEAKENSYIVEAKYKRVWKVTSINRKLSANGKSFGYSIEVRAIQSYEKQWGNMNVFGKPINPFFNNELPDEDD